MLVARTASIGRGSPGFLLVTHLLCVQYRTPTSKLYLELIEVSWMSWLDTRDVSSLISSTRRWDRPGLSTMTRYFTRNERVWTSSSASRFMPPSSRSELK